MGMTVEVLNKRRKYLGASETATILGYGTYAGQTGDSIYWSKVGPAVEHDAEHLQMGNDLEPALVAFAHRKLDTIFETDPEYCFKVLADGIGAGILAATPDGVSPHKKWGLEGKAVMHGNPGVDQWGDDGTDKVPDSVIIQCQQQMAVWDLDVVFVPVLWCLSYRPEFRIYRVERDPELWDMCIAPRAVEWWNKHIVAQVPPGDEPIPLDVVKRMERKQGLFVDADAETAALIESWDACRQSKNQTEKDADGLLREILTRLGEAEGFTLSNGKVFSYKQQNGARRCDLDALQQRYPAAYAELVTQGKHRTPRIVGKAKVTA